MKYQVGDRVKIKSFDWFRNGACIGFNIFMAKYCGEVFTIESKNEKLQKYYMIEDRGTNAWTDDMIECAMNISKLGTAANPVEPKLNANCLTRERVDELAIKIDKELPSGNQNVWELPDGYQFVDENGNVINATIIALEKKKTEYPKTYEECCKELNIAVRDFDILYNMLDTTEIIYTNNLDRLLNSFRKLLICRDAYWKIAGEEMGLGKPWEPDYSEESYEQGSPIKYVIYYTGNNITKGRMCTPSYILSFPTEEMRDDFYEAFRKKIEICKEIL